MFRWLIGGCFLVGAPFVLIGAHEAYDTASQLRRGEQVEGSVVANRLTVDHRDGNEERSYQPEVTFRAQDGSAHRFTDAAGSLPPDYAVGDAVTVLYWNQDPNHPRIVSWKRLWLVPCLLMFVGVLPGCISWLVIARVTRQGLT